MGRYDEARAAYGAALRAEPQLAEAAYNLGSLDEDCGDVEQAIGHYRHALAIRPDYGDAHFNLAAALARTGRNDAAVAHWQRYLDLDSGSPWARIARAHLELVEPPEGDRRE
jgi:tetratricopeptide (TPR) repeat protein